MSLRWPILDYIDTELPLTTKQRRAINREAWRRWLKRRNNFVLYLAVIIPLNLILNLVPALIRELTGRSAYWHWPMAIGIYVICAVAAIALLQRWRFAPLVRVIVREHGYDVCIKCGYWLRGLDARVDRCPECGAKREPIQNATSDEPAE
jgi:hypothetical protein